MGIKVRRDKNALLFFDQSNGNKVRLALGRYDKARVPELADIKITDYCPFKCTFCYQDSTTAGSHATMENMEFIISELAKHNVLEVALGGGEPTDHPHFKQILWLFREAGIVPNFTTKSLGWPKRNWPLIEHSVGAFAFSAEEAHDVKMAASMFKDIPNDRINIHYVMGLQTQREFMEFMRAAHTYHYRVTLLGYKTVGRGKDVIPHDYSRWIHHVGQLIAQEQCPTFSIDTPLAEEYADRLPVDQRLFHTREGFVSVYIDAVAMGMSASSFENQNLVPFDSKWVKRFEKVGI